MGRRMRRESEMQVRSMGEFERWASGLASTAMGSFGLRRGGVLGLLALAGAGFLAWRMGTGRSLLPAARRRAPQEALPAPKSARRPRAAQTRTAAPRRKAVAAAPAEDKANAKPAPAKTAGKTAGAKPAAKSPARKAPARAGRTAAGKAAKPRRTGARKAETDTGPATTH